MLCYQKLRYVVVVVARAELKVAYYVVGVVVILVIGIVVDCLWLMLWVATQSSVHSVVTAVGRGREERQLSKH